LKLCAPQQFVYGLVYDLLLSVCEDLRIVAVIHLSRLDKSHKLLK